MPLINDILMVSTLMYVCQHSSQSQPTSKKCKQWISTSWSPLCTTASILSRLAKCSFSCFVHPVSILNLTSKFTPSTVYMTLQNIQRARVFWQTPFFKFLPLAFSPICPELQIHCSKKVKPSAVHLSINRWPGIVWSVCAIQKAYMYYSLDKLFFFLLPCVLVVWACWWV